ncbi:MAG: hypothetical protein ACKVS8_02150 [Phycisphaerales bacterium]
MSTTEASASPTPQALAAQAPPARVARRVSTRVLVVANVALVGLLVSLGAWRAERGRAAREAAAPGVLEAAAMAQFGVTQGPLGQPPGAPGPTSRARGQYLMLSGRTLGSNANSIFLVDTMNQELVGVRWDKAARKLAGIGYRNLAADAAANQQGTGR